MPRGSTETEKTAYGPSSCRSELTWIWPSGPVTTSEVTRAVEEPVLFVAVRVKVGWMPYSGTSIRAVKSFGSAGASQLPHVAPSTTQVIVTPESWAGGEVNARSTCLLSPVGVAETPVNAPGVPAATMLLASEAGES